MKDLETLRKEINEIDEKMAKLFSSRLDVVKEIGEYKKSKNLEIKDSQREEIVIKQNKALLEINKQKYYEEFIKKVIEISCDYQK